MTEERGVPKTQTDLREMVYHTDARVTAMEGQLNTVAQGQHRTESKLDQLIHHLNQPPNINWAAWVGVGISILVMVVGGTIGFTNYIHLTQTPIVVDTTYNRDKIQELREFQRETHYEFGIFHTQTERAQEDRQELWDHVHQRERKDEEQDGQLSRLEEQVKQNNSTDEWVVDQLEMLRQTYNADVRAGVGK